MSWWEDRHGDAQYFWSGNQSNHTCECGIQNNCIVSDVLCNCDTIAPMNLFDDGMNLFQMRQ